MIEIVTVMSKQEMKRCEWVKSELMMRYHDTEWGVPVHDDRKLFEAIVLQGAQAGLSWETILKRRKGYRKAFHGFDPVKVASYTKKDVQRLLADESIIRNRLKIEAAINNAKKFLDVQEEFGSFDKYIWKFVDYRAIKNFFKTVSDIPPKAKESDKMSENLRKRGFRFVGPTICYAMMQAVGMVNDHVVGCFRHRKI